MGTTKSGRYLNTKGSSRSLSDFAVVNSNEGDFELKNIHINGKLAKQIRLANGGHGKQGANLLDKYDEEKEMMIDKIRAAIYKMATIDDEWDYGVEQSWNELIDICSLDINNTILFLNECTADEFFWFSEAFDEIAKKTHSKEFITALYKIASKYPEETQKNNILNFIKSAESIVDVYYNTEGSKKLT